MNMRDMQKSGHSGGRKMSFAEVQEKMAAEAATKAAAEEKANGGLGHMPENNIQNPALIPQQPKKEPDSDANKPPMPKQSNAGRKKWGIPAMLPKTNPSDATTMVNAKFTPEEHRMLMSARFLRGDLKANNILRWSTNDTLNHTYICANPECGGEFTARSTSLAEAPTPKCCPFCGENNFLPVKFTV